jgi:hypothetical protein
LAAFTDGDYKHPFGLSVTGPTLARPERKHTLRLTATLLPIIFVCLIVGGAGVAYGFYSLVETRAFVRNATVHHGIVVELHKRSVRVNEPAGTTATTRYTVEYNAADGTVAQVRSRVSSNPSAFEVGDRVQVLIARHGNTHRADVRLDTLQELYMPEATLLFGGLIFTVAGVSCVAVGRRQMWREVVKHFRQKKRHAR